MDSSNQSNYECLILAIDGEDEQEINKYIDTVDFTKLQDVMSILEDQFIFRNTICFSRILNKSSPKNLTWDDLKNLFERSIHQKHYYNIVTIDNWMRTKQLIGQNQHLCFIRSCRAYENPKCLGWKQDLILKYINDDDTVGLNCLLRLRFVFKPENYLERRNIKNPAILLFKYHSRTSDQEFDNWFIENYHSYANRLKYCLSMIPEAVPTSELIMKRLISDGQLEIIKTYYSGDLQCSNYLIYCKKINAQPEIREFFREILNVRNNYAQKRKRDSESSASSVSSNSSSSSDAGSDDVGNECQICFFDLPTRELTCSHGNLFHKTCIDKWLQQNNTCPYCRAVQK